MRENKQEGEERKLTQGRAENNSAQLSSMIDRELKREREREDIFRF